MINVNHSFTVNRKFMRIISAIKIGLLAPAGNQKGSALRCLFSVLNGCLIIARILCEYLPSLQIYFGLRDGLVNVRIGKLCPGENGVQVLPFVV